MRAARRLFAEAGGSIALDAVAEAAGVGIATLYRNFESREALVEQVALAILSDLDDATAELAEHLRDEPGPAWQAYVVRLVELDLGALAAALSVDLAGGLSVLVQDAQTHSLTQVEEALNGVREARLVPADLEALEFIVAIGIATRPQPLAVTRAAPHMVERLVGLVIAGLRAEATS
ncbi:TetR/AcrR family transcriptional regulator [Nocardioides gilvus]|uniref:TetR/AcrR family transcriptional regulator n=1 Tax=Nocardioides gilvus TaxID=1735589 RepID=UPI00194E586E|nr:TetR/AcrR family transcriptional regulator [Nocardioides gilvus]